MEKVVKGRTKKPALPTHMLFKYNQISGMSFFFFFKQCKGLLKPLDSKHMKWYLDNDFTLMVFFLIRKMLPKCGIPLFWLNAILWGLPEAEEKQTHGRLLKR